MFRSIALSLFILCASPTAANEADVLSRVSTHFVIEDYRSAHDELVEALQIYPDSMEIRKAYLRTLAKLGEERKMLKVLQSTFPPDKVDELDSLLIEDISWGVIEKGWKSSSLPIRLISLVGAHLSKDIRGVHLVIEGLNDKSLVIQSLAARFAGMERDHQLKEALVKKLRSETPWRVKAEVVSSLGMMKAVELRDELITHLEDDRRSFVDQRMVIASLVNMFEDIDRETLLKMTQSKHSGLRMMACDIVRFLELEEHIDVVEGLIHDTHPHVRASSYFALAQLRDKISDKEKLLEIAQKGARDVDPFVQVHGAYLLMLTDEIRGRESFRRLMSTDSIEDRLLAAGALAQSGPNGIEVLKDTFEIEKDPIIKLNLAVGLIGHRQKVEEAGRSVADYIENHHERIHRGQVGAFRAFVPNAIIPGEGFLRVEELQNQAARMELCSILAMINHPNAENAIKEFLNSRTWGMAGAACMLLLQEGSEEALDVVKQQMESASGHLKIQSALALAFWGKDPVAVDALKAFYPNVNKETKERILEGMGYSGGIASVPFLVSCLEEPYQSLRIIAASAIIQSLYH